MISSFLVGAALSCNMSSIDLNRLQILKNNPTVSHSSVELIKAAATKAASKHDIPERFLLAIAFIESSYKLDAVNNQSNDYGIMQVNQWHVDRNNWSVELLLGNYDYSVDKGAKVFSWFYKKYPIDEAVMRYNCGTRPRCIQWRSVKLYLKKFKAAL